MPLSCRPRRNRRSQALRSAFQETTLSPANLVYPLFIHEGELGLCDLPKYARAVGVNSIVLFPKVPDALKVIYTDVALDPYSSDGHDGIVREDGVDETVHQLCKQAVAQVKPGLPYLDIIRLLRDNSPLSIAAY
ncbi:hypothetical protein RD792_012187 [Penstemon davidsonii]|uniref:porphobilinogen synthase n=1 Tax=Penstemon davidsonii TaxID=160366 RepID=A0ABR0CW59_9LAMI|nr:hypothetical protein RD792_012187 [Penstemon davidsonii]